MQPVVEGLTSATLSKLWSADILVANDSFEYEIGRDDFAKNVETDFLREANAMHWGRGDTARMLRSRRVLRGPIESSVTAFSLRSRLM